MSRRDVFVRRVTICIAVSVPMVDGAGVTVTVDAILDGRRDLGPPRSQVR